MPIEGQQIPAQPDGRQEQRFPVRLPALLRSGALIARVELLDLSRGGALATADFPPTRGRRVRLCRERLEVSARVVWSSQKRFGVEFEAPLTATDLFIQLSHSRKQLRMRNPAAA